MGYRPNKIRHAGVQGQAIQSIASFFGSHIVDKISNQLGKSSFSCCLQRSSIRVVISFIKYAMRLFHPP